MARFKVYNLDQGLLLPASLHEYVPEGHLARLVHTVVEGIETTGIESKYSDLGQNTYHPKILLKLLFYGYAVGERSGRKIARRCETDTAYMYLSQMYRPDFRTINDFRKNNLDELSGYFVDIVRMCRELGLVKLGQINIDGTKIKANASNRRSKTKKEYKRWLKEIEEKIGKILAEADEVDSEEEELYGDKRGDELPDDINTEEKMKKKLEGVVKKFKGGKKKVNFTDSDAEFMLGGNGRIEVSYNCQAAVTDDQIIVSSEVTREANDWHMLKAMVETTEANVGEEVKEISADAGYSSYANYEYLDRTERVGYIPDQGLRKLERDGPGVYKRERFTYDAARDEYICPAGQRLKRYGERHQDAQYGNCHRQWRQVIYRGSSCGSCAKKSLCTKDRQRRLSIDARVMLLEQMRERLRTEEGRKKYRKRSHTVEPIFGHLKFNLGYRQFLLRSLQKVVGEFRLMCIGYNLKRMNRLLAPAC